MKSYGNSPTTSTTNYKPTIYKHDFLPYQNHVFTLSAFVPFSSRGTNTIGSETLSQPTHRDRVYNKAYRLFGVSLWVN